MRRSAWSIATFALSTVFIFQLSRGIASPVLPLYYSSLGFSAVAVGVLFSIWGVGTIVFEPTVGFFADRGRRGAIMFGICIATCVFYLAVTWSNSFLDLAILQFLIGGMYAGAAVIFRYAIPSVVSPDRPSAAYGILGATFSASAIIGSLLGGFLLSTSGYAIPFYLASAGAVITSIPLWLSRIGGRPPQFQTEVGGPQPTAEGRLLELILMGGMAMSAFLIFSVIYTMMPLVMIRSPFGASPFEVGVLLAVFNMSMLLFQPIMGHVGAFRPRAWMSAGLLTGILSFLLLVFAKSTAVAYLAAFLAGISFSAISTHSLARFTRLVHHSRRGVAIGVYGAAEDIGVIVGPLVFSFLWTAVSLDTALAFISAALLVVLVAYAFPRRAPLVSVGASDLVSQS